MVALAPLNGRSFDGNGADGLTAVYFDNLQGDDRDTLTDAKKDKNVLDAIVKTEEPAMKQTIRSKNLRFIYIFIIYTLFIL